MQVFQLERSEFVNPTTIISVFKVPGWLLNDAIKLMYVQILFRLFHFSQPNRQSKDVYSNFGSLVRDLCQYQQQ